MKSLYHLFYMGFIWNTLESLLYQLILTIHIILLYQHMDAHLFGLMGVLFSTLYLLTFLANGGLDTALAPYARSLSTNSAFWRQILIPHALAQLIIYSVLGGIGLAINQFMLSSSTRLALIPAITLALLLITESTKKTLRTIAHLSFNNRRTTLIELGGIGTYVLTIWLLYSYYNQLSLAILFIPLLITSTISCFLLGIHLYTIYSHLTTGPSNGALPTQRQFVMTRLYTYGAHLGHILFSTNFLIPFFALHIGLTYAGIFKLLSTITRSMQSILNTMFGPTSQALFAHMQGLPTAQKQHLFFTITEQLHHILFGCIIFFIINYQKFLPSLTLPLLSETHTLIILFFIIQCTEQLFIVYEKFFIAHHATAYICALSLFSVTLCALLVMIPLPSTTLMILLLGLRLLTISAMAILAYYLFGITPALTCRIDYLMYASIIAALFFVFF